MRCSRDLPPRCVRYLLLRARAPRARARRLPLFHKTENRMDMFCSGKRPLGEVNSVSSTTTTLRGQGTNRGVLFRARARG